MEIKLLIKLKEFQKRKKKYLEKDIYLGQKIIDDLRLKTENYWWSKIIIII